MDDLEFFGLTLVGDHGIRLMLTGGANVVGGTQMKGTSSGSEAQDGAPGTVERLWALAPSIDRPDRQSTTTYGLVSAERLNAAASSDAFRRQRPVAITTACTHWRRTK